MTNEQTCGVLLLMVAGGWIGYMIGYMRAYSQMRKGNKS